MEKQRNFEDLYCYICNNSNEIDFHLEEAKKERRHLNKIKFIVCLVFDIIMLCICMPFFMNSAFSIYYIFPMFWTLIALAFLNCFVCIIINVLSNGKQKKYNDKFKEIIIQKIIENFYDNLEYYPNKGVSELIYRDAKYNEYYNRYYSEDYIEAKIDNNYDIDLAEVETKKEETYKDSDGNTYTSEEIIFHGLFAKIVIDKSINSRIVIAKNNKLIFDKKRQKMDFSEFEKYFDVASDNKILAMQILTPDIMLELLNFLNRYNVIFDIIINDSVIYIRFHCGSMFESANLKKGALDRDTLEKYYNMVKLTYNLSSDLINIIKDLEI